MARARCSTCPARLDDHPRCPGVPARWCPTARNRPVLYLLARLPRLRDCTDCSMSGLPGPADPSPRRRGLPAVRARRAGGTRVSHRDTEWANAVNGTDQFETFVTGNVIRAVEGSHLPTAPTLAQPSPGSSMGGYGAVNLALRHPDPYGAGRPDRGYSHVDDPVGVFGQMNSWRSTRTRRSLHDRCGSRSHLAVDGDGGVTAPRSAGSRPLLTSSWSLPMCRHRTSSSTRRPQLYVRRRRVP